MSKLTKDMLEKVVAKDLGPDILNALGEKGVRKCDAIYEKIVASVDNHFTEECDDTLREATMNISIISAYKSLVGLCHDVTDIVMAGLVIGAAEGLEETDAIITKYQEMAKDHIAQMQWDMGLDILTLEEIEEILPPILVEGIIKQYGEPDEDSADYEFRKAQQRNKNNCKDCGKCK